MLFGRFVGIAEENLLAVEDGRGMGPAIEFRLPENVLSLTPGGRGCLIRRGFAVLGGASPGVPIFG